MYLFLDQILQIHLFRTRFDHHKTQSKYFENTGMSKVRKQKSQEPHAHRT